MIKKNILSILVALIIAFLSLANGNKMDVLSLIRYRDFDKIVHFTMYFALMAVMIWENRNALRNNGLIFLVGLIPFFFGLLLELLQNWIATSRSGSIYDLLFNLAGIMFAIVTFLLARHFGRENIRY
jgi:VanZ family protein